MTVLPLGSSDDLRVGEMVVAVGNPLGLTHTVTSGLLSAKERILPAEDFRLVDFLQTDSSFGPGSSGGPLLNLRGEVVGVNTAVVATGSIGFAIPIDTVKEVLPLLILGRSERGWFGASAGPAGPDDARAQGLGATPAVVVRSVTPGSPADAAGLRAGDVVVRLDGAEVESFLAFRRRLLGKLPGQRLSLEVVRAGVPLEIESELAERPRDSRARATPGPLSPRAR